MEAQLWCLRPISGRFVIIIKPFIVNMVVFVS